MEILLALHRSRKRASFVATSTSLRQKAQSLLDDLRSERMPAADSIILLAMVKLFSLDNPFGEREIAQMESYAKHSEYLWVVGKTPLGRPVGGGKFSDGCKYFSSGKCFRGASCAFQHSKDKAPSSSPPSSSRRRRKSAGVCIDYVHGACSRGDNCKFSHSVPHNTEKRVCPFFADGECRRGRSCKLVHSACASSLSRARK